MVQGAVLIRGSDQQVREQRRTELSHIVYEALPFLFPMLDGEE
jgi:hypothetical protein